MHLKSIVAVSLLVLSAHAAPQDGTACSGTSPAVYGGSTSCTSSVFDFTTTTTLSLTLTVSSTHTCTVTAVSSNTASSVSSTPLTQPTAAYSLISARSASPVHLLPWSAAGFRFWLGGSTASYCPESVNQTGSCPPGTATAFLGTCAMDVEVPGGQQIYVTPTGEIGYTQAHSISIPQGANICPFEYNKPVGSSVGYVTLSPNVAFSAGGFMACPTDSGYYQVFASIPNATVPQGDINACLVFDALAGDYGDGGLAAWQYT